MRKSFHLLDVRVNNTSEDIRLRSNLTTIKTIKFTKKSFFDTILDSTQSHPGALGDIEEFVHIIPGTYRSERPKNNTGNDKLFIKSDCYIGPTVNGVQEPVLRCLTLDKPPGH